MSELMTTDELSEFLRVPKATIYAWHQKGTGPPAMRVGKYLRYRRDGVERWLLEREHDSQYAAHRAGGGAA